MRRLTEKTDAPTRNMIQMMARKNASAPKLLLPPKRNIIAIKLENESDQEDQCLNSSHTNTSRL